MGSAMNAAEESLYECFGAELEQGLPPNFTAANKATVVGVAQEAEKMWGDWKDKETPSPYYASLHRYNLEFLRHFAEGTRQLSVAFEEEDASKFLMSIGELNAAVEAKTLGISEAQKIVLEQGL